MPRRPECIDLSANAYRPTCQKTSKHHGTRSRCRARVAGCCCCRWVLPAGHLPLPCPAAPRLLATFLAAAVAGAPHCTAHQAAAGAAGMPSCLPRCYQGSLRCRAAAAAGAARVAVGTLSPLSPSPALHRPSGLALAAAAFSAACGADSRVIQGAQTPSAANQTKCKSILERSTALSTERCRSVFQISLRSWQS